MPHFSIFSIHSPLLRLRLLLLRRRRPLPLYLLRLLVLRLLLLRLLLLLLLLHYLLLSFLLLLGVRFSISSPLYHHHQARFTNRIYHPARFSNRSESEHRLLHHPKHLAEVAEVAEH